MNVGQVVKTPKVEADLIDHFVYLAQQGGVELGDRFLTPTNATFNDLLRMPAMGKERHFKNPRCGEIRSWRIEGFENYLVFYRAFHGGIEIVRVLHGAQDLERYFEE